MLETDDLNASVVMAFDYGSKKIGVAMGQLITRTATPLTTLPNLQGEPLWTEIGKLIRLWQPDIFVVGLPLNMDDTPSEMSKRVQAFAQELSTRFKKPLHFVDERLTTRAARERLKEQDAYRRENRLEVDQIAAQIILESWLNEQKG